MLWWDDAILGLAYVFFLIHCGTLCQAIAIGLGASIIVIAPDEVARAAKLYFASRIFSIVGLCLSKISILIFTRRIFSGNFDHEQILFQMAYSAVALYGVCGLILSSIGCYPELVLLPTLNLVCKANMARWCVITALDVLTEIILMAIPIHLVCKNTLRKSKKGIVIFIFSFRILVIAFSIAGLAAYNKFFTEHNNRVSIGIARTVAWQEITLAFSLMTASIPCLKAFLDAFRSTGLSTTYGRNRAAYRTSGVGPAHDSSEPEAGRSNVTATTMPSSSGKRRPRVGTRHSGGISRRLRPDTVSYNANVATTHDTSSKLPRLPESLESFRSDQLEIQRDVEVRVTHS